MPTYCTVQDVKLALAPVSEWADDDDSTAVSLPQDQIEDAINEAEAIVKSHLLVRYVITPAQTVQIVLPVGDPPVEEDVMAAPQPVRYWTRDIAAFLATLTHRKGKDLGEDDPIRLRYNMVMGFLMAVRDHKMNLDLPVVGSDAGADGGVTVVNLYEGKLFDLEDVGLGFGNQDRQRFEPYRNQWS